jgi:hypothetical protein
MTSFEFNNFLVEAWEQLGAWYSTGFDSSQLGPFDSEEEAIAASIESAKKSGAEECEENKTYPSNWDKKGEF